MMDSPDKKSSLTRGMTHVRGDKTFYLKYMRQEVQLTHNS